MAAGTNWHNPHKITTLVPLEKSTEGTLAPASFAPWQLTRTDEMEVTDMGLTGMVFSMISIALGAVLCWAVTSPGHGFRLSTVGVILMVVGAIGLVISAVVFATTRRPVGTQNRIYDRAVTDTEGRTAAVHEEVHN